MKVSWDDYSQYMETKMFQTTNQYYVCIEVSRWFLINQLDFTEIFDRLISIDFFSRWWIEIQVTQATQATARDGIPHYQKSMRKRWRAHHCHCSG